MRLEHLEKRFGEVRAVDDISLAIEPGEFITLLGPSGSGKTTTLRMLAGFEMPTAGEILIDERPIVRVLPHRRNIGMVFQNYALFPHMTVAENVGFPLKMRRIGKEEARSRIAAALRIVNLPGYEARYPRQLSGGQQQRVALARAIVFNPQVLLMDEPLGALDRQLRERLQFEIKRIQEELGITVVYVTHDQQEALVMSDRIAVMNQGRVEQVGMPSQLYDQPANRFVAAFVGESNFLSGAITRLDPLDPSRVAVRVGAEIFAATADTLKAAVPGDEVVLAIRPEKLSFAGELAEPESEPVNRLAATVREAVFLGEMRRYLLDTDLGATLILKQQQRHEAPTHAPGERVQVIWHAADTRVVSE